MPIGSSSTTDFFAVTLFNTTSSRMGAKSGALKRTEPIRSRTDIEKMLGKKVHIRLWVKVRGGWSDDEKALKSLGYIDLSE